MAILVFVKGTHLVMTPHTNTITFECLLEKDEPEWWVTVWRDYPLSDLLSVRRPWIQFSQTVRPLTPDWNKGYVCVEDNHGGQRYSHDGVRGFGRWSLTWAKNCTSDPKGFHWESRWTGYLFDTIPLRPITMERTVLKVDHPMSMRRGPQGPQGEPGPPGPMGPPGPAGVAP